MFKFFINFKTYPQGTGKRAIELVKVCAKISSQEQVKIIPIVQTVDVFQVKEAVAGEIWVQHLDWQEPGQATGWINLEAVAEAGALGTLINHSEHRLPPGTIKQTLKRIKGFNKNFATMVCGGTLGQLKKLVFTKPDYLAYEVKELIAGSASIAKSRPQSVRKAVALSREKKIPLIIGAGINNSEDVFLAKKMGAQGVLISSAVVLADNSKEKLRELVTINRGDQ
ncbi:MAG: triose-phosphate isomerase [Candidatus Shapirobacteria bacterium]|nr:triose-phosphate isomerase [Candidatus Shapirobacteria bacterium]